MARIQSQSAQLAREGLKRAISLFSEKKSAYYKDFVKMESTTQLYEEYLQEGDFGAPRIVNEATGIQYDDFQTPFSKKFTPQKRAIGFAVSLEAIEPEQGYGVISKRVPKLGLAMNKGREIACANLLNLATNTAAANLGPDSKPLAATDHPLESGTASNRGVGGVDIALGITALEQAVQELGLQKSHRGDPFPQMGPFKLLVHFNNAMLAQRLAGASQLPQTADNDPNPAGNLIAKVCVNPYFTSPTAWALRSAGDDEHELFLLVKRDLRVKDQEDIDKDIMKYVVSEIYIPGFMDWRGFWYSAGA